MFFVQLHVYFEHCYKYNFYIEHYFLCLMPIQGNCYLLGCEYGFSAKNICKLEKLPYLCIRKSEQDGLFR